jgi:hypothetical protein
LGIKSQQNGSLLAKLGLPIKTKNTWWTEIQSAGLLNTWLWGLYEGSSVVDVHGTLQCPPYVCSILFYCTLMKWNNKYEIFFQSSPWLLEEQCCLSFRLQKCLQNAGAYVEISH